MTKIKRKRKMKIIRKTRVVIKRKRSQKIRTPRKPRSR